MAVAPLATSRVMDVESDIEALMPKLRHSSYYTKPTIEELAARERAYPGYCRDVWNFVVGRHGVGSIRFIGFVDVRRLDLESFFTFEDDGRFLCRVGKQPLLGYNYTAEITLVAGKFSAGFIKNMEDQGLVCVSYDRINEEAKFVVSYVSWYGVIRFNKLKHSIKRLLNFMLFPREVFWPNSNLL